MADSQRWRGRAIISNTIRHPISGLLAAGLVLVAGVLPAAAQQRLGAVVCVGSELETLASSNPVRRLIRTDTELVYRVGVDVSEFDRVEDRLLAELDGPEEVSCVWSDSGDSHLVVLGYTGVVRQDLTIDPEDPRFQGFAIGYGMSWEEAEEYATRLDARYVSTNDGSGYQVLVRETWGIANAGAGAGGEPARAPGVRTPVSEPAAAALEPGTVFRDCAGCPEMVVVPAGSFMMGSPATEAGRWGAEGPRHRVTIGSAFAAGMYEGDVRGMGRVRSCGRMRRTQPG